MGVSSEGYQDQILTLLPRGIIWQGAELQALVSAFAVESHRLSDRIDDLLLEFNPATSTELLPDWERVLAVPFPGFELEGTWAGRRREVVSRLIAQGGASKAYFIGVAESLGHVDVTITDGIKPFCAGDPCGSPLYGPLWVFLWIVNITEAGPDLKLEYLFNRYKPAHTAVDFIYA